MASTDSSKPNLSLAISYGFVGGKAHGNKLRKLARQQGLSISSLEQANIIVAHSAGCWLIPKTASPKLIIYVGMPLAVANPRDTLLRANIAAGQQGRSVSSLKHRARKGYYTFRHARRNVQIIRSAKQLSPVLFPAAQSVFIANQHDPWVEDAQLDQYLRQKNWSFISLPGAHDNIWIDPAPYADIIKHYARLLV